MALDKAIDFVTKDFDGFVALMKSKIPELTPEWTDTSKTDLGIILIELQAYGLDILAYYLDKAVNENNLFTASTRKSVIQLCKFLGYELATQKASEYLVVITKVDVGSSIEIPAGVKFSTNPDLGTPIVFELQEPLSLIANVVGDEIDGNGSYMYAVRVKQGESAVAYIVVPSDGNVVKTIKLPNNNVLSDSLDSILVDGEVWTRVDNFLNSSSADLHYTTSVDENFETSLTFGNGTSGKALTSGSTMIVAHRVGGGTIGNVGIGSINTVVDDILASQLIVTNPTTYDIEGKDYEDISLAKQLAPANLRTNDRAVTKGDFEDLSVNHEGVGRAYCQETFNANGDVRVYILDSHGELPSNTLKASLLTYLQSKSTLNIFVSVLDASKELFDLDVAVTTTVGYRSADVKARVEQAIVDTCTWTNFSLGQQIPLSYFYKVLMAISGVEDLTINSPITAITPISSALPFMSSYTVSVIGGV